MADTFGGGSKAVDVLSSGELCGGPGFGFVGGYGWLDFVNTEFVEGGRIVDRLGDVADLIHWLRESDLVGPQEAEAALGRLEGTAEGEHLLAQAREFRETLRETARRFVGEGYVAPAPVEEVNRLLARRPGHYRLEGSDGGFELRFHALPDGPEALLAPVAGSVARFLAEADPSLVKNCENPECILLFYDTSKNRSRRWCSMATCGNRMKARAHYKRTRERRDG